MDILNNFLGLGKTMEEATTNARTLVQTSMASILGNLTNPGGLIPYTVKSIDDLLERTIGSNGKVDKLAERLLDQADKWVDKQLKKVKIGA